MTLNGTHTAPDDDDDTSCDLSSIDYSNSSESDQPTGNLFR
jgi:hypothetical protein